MIQTYLDGHTEYQIRDHLGSTRLTIRATIVSTLTKNQTNKTLTTTTKVDLTYQSVDYNPYGEKLGSNSTDKRVDGYGGNIYDGETDYVPMGARWYLPEIGRFLSADPMWASFPALSPYIYANDNPMSFKDPSGLAPEKEETEKVESKKIEKKGRTNRTLGSGSLLYQSWESLDEWQRENTFSGLAEPSNGERIGMESAMEGNHVTLGLMDQMKGFGTYNYWMKELGIDGGGSNGMITGCLSTIIDLTGEVIDVIWDGKTDIYQVGTKEEYIKKMSSFKTDAEKRAWIYKQTYIGKSWAEDDFADENGRPKGHIYVNSSFNAIFWQLRGNAAHSDLYGIMEHSKSGREFDVKSQYEGGDYGGYMLFGRYTTLENIGNYLAGANACDGTILGTHISFDMYMRLAGWYHVHHHLSGAEIVAIIFGCPGPVAGTPPYYGEIEKCGRYVWHGWNKWDGWGQGE